MAVDTAHDSVGSGHWPKCWGYNPHRFPRRAHRSDADTGQDVGTKRMQGREDQKEMGDPSSSGCGVGRKLIKWRLSGGDGDGVGS